MKIDPCPVTAGQLVAYQNGFKRTITVGRVTQVLTLVGKEYELPTYRVHLEPNISFDGTAEELGRWLKPVAEFEVP